MLATVIIFSDVGFPLSSSSYRAVLAFSPSVFLCFIGYSHAAFSGAAPFERRAVTLLPGALASVSFPFRSRRLFWDLSGGRHGRPGIRRPGRHARPFVWKKKKEIARSGKKAGTEPLLFPNKRKLIFSNNREWLATRRAAGVVRRIPNDFLPHNFF